MEGTSCTQIDQDDHRYESQGEWRPVQTNNNPEVVFAASQYDARQAPWDLEDRKS